MIARNAYEASYPAAKLARNGEGYNEPFGGMWAVWQAAEASVGAPTVQVDALTDEQIHEGVKALLGCTTSEVEDFSPKMIEAYSADVQRVYSAILAASQPAAPVQAGGSIRDFAEFREELERLSEPGLSQKQAKVIRKGIYDTIDARVRNLAAPAPREAM